MAKDVSVMSFLFCLFTLSFHSLTSSGISVGFLYDARKGSDSHWSFQDTLSFLERNKVMPSQFKVLVTTNSATKLGSLTSNGFGTDIYLTQLELEKFVETKIEASLMLDDYVKSRITGTNISSISVTFNKLDVSSLVPLLKSIELALEKLKLSRRMKVEIMLPLSAIETLDERQLKLVEKVVNFRRKIEVYLTIEVLVAGELNMGDEFAHSVVERALSACVAIPSQNIPLILHVKSSVVPTAAQMSNFTTTLNLIKGHALLQKRVSELFVDISHLEIEQNKLYSETKMLSLSSRRELLDHGPGVKTATKIMVRDGSYIPITNPATTPTTVPYTSPTTTTPEVVTIPSNNPTTLYPTNPAMTPVTQTPVAVPSVDPYTTPAVPITNPATTPSTTFPVSPSVTNPTSPTTTYPFTPTMGTPYIAPPITVPGTSPFTPATSGQTWCVAKTGVPDQYLQSGLDFACGMGGVDCSQLQLGGSCYNPNTLQAHASYAFNSYYQRNPVPTSCDFGGTAMLVNVNPSTATCVFASSSSFSTSTPATTYNPVPTYTPTYTPGSTYNPVSGGFGSSTGSGSSVYNSNYPGGSNPVYGSYNPSSSSVTRLTLSASRIFCYFVPVIVYLSVQLEASFGF